MNLQIRPEEQTTETVYFTRPAEHLAAKPAAENISAPEPESEPYVSPVDFDALWEENTDIYAWLDIPGTEISYPLLQHPEDDAYYLRRNIRGEDDRNGVLFTEASYNGRDFSDPLTIIYGHNRYNGQMFSTLQSTYSSAEALAEHEEIVIYLPDRELHYHVFAAVPYDNRHILYNYDFSNERTFRLFFQEILSVRAMEAVFAEDAAISPDDQAIILSTCLTSNQSNRFLVCGKLAQAIPAD